MSNHSSFATPTVLTLHGGSSGVIDLDLFDVPTCKLMTEVVYPSGTSSTTGISIQIYTGPGAIDPTADGNLFVVGGTSYATFSNNYNIVPSMIQPNGGLGVSSTTRNAFYLNTATEAYFRWVRMLIVNLDASKSCTVKMYGEF